MKKESDKMDRKVKCSECGADMSDIAHDTVHKDWELRNIIGWNVTWLRCPECDTEHEVLYSAKFKNADITIEKLKKISHL